MGILSPSVVVQIHLARPTMGYFRRFKLSDYSADECSRNMGKIVHKILASRDKMTPVELGGHLENWACFRELLARHENQNKSQLDDKV